jgi:translocation and assembly module TamA
MIRKLLAAAALAALCALAPAARAQSEPEPAFDLVVRAPDALRALLERHLELRRYQQVSDLDDAELARLVVLADKDARELLATQGYFSPEVRITREAGPPRPKLVVTVEAGPATKVSAVDIVFEGDIAMSSEADAVAQREGIRRDWELPVGQGFTQGRWDAAKAGALRRLLARRYPAGRISYSLADIEAASQQARLGLKLDSGAVFHLGELHVSGVQRYDPLLVTRLARLPVGMVYDQEKLVQAQLRLAGSGYFDSAFLYVDPQADPAAAPVQVTVREAPLQKAVVGLGFTTDGGPRASLEHTHNRVPGVGWRAITKLQAETRNPYAQSEWLSIPDPGNWRWSVLARVEKLDDDRLVTYSQRLRGGRLQSGEHIDRNVYVQYERSTVQNPNNVVLTPQDTGSGTAVSANYIWTGRYFDNVTQPTSGYGLGFELGGGVTLTGSSRLFQRTVVRGLWLRPLGRSRVQLRGEMGAVVAQADAQVPSTQLFRTGGDNTVRGYKYLDIGVPLSDGVVGPGRLMTVASVEWQRPIELQGRPSAFENTLFLDVGAVADHFDELRPRAGLGTGVRWRSPVGPLEAAVAYGFYPRKLRLHITAGFVF